MLHACMKGHNETHFLNCKIDKNKGGEEGKGIKKV
jgi:hypothetical protein